VAYLSIDMNIVLPEIAALEFFWDRLVPGAVVMLDDYGWATHRAQKAAFDAFARAHDAMILSVPTGQGIIIR
jgi:O-methyltransferase